MKTGMLAWLSPSVYLRLLPLLVLSTLQGCSTIQYYAQSVNGQMEILSGSRPVAELLADAETSEALRRRLALTQQARTFAVRELGLPDNDSYRSYVDLGRPYVVWNVVAAPEFSLQPRTWCFPVVGCLAYRGYFAREDAQRQGQALRDAGYDVSVAGVTAYSTLGWFDDPLLNTMMQREEYELVGLIFHELAHQRLYVKGDSAFNESFAMLVEEEGLCRWMCSDDRASGEPAAESYARYLRQRRWYRQFVRLVLQTGQRLETLYSQQRTASEMRARKDAIFEEMRAAYARLKKGHAGLRGYDEWMAQGLNNARIVSVTMYHEWVPAFRYLLRRQGGRFEDFYRQAAALARQPQQQRDAILSRWLELEAARQPSSADAPCASGKRVVSGAVGY